MARWLCRLVRQKYDRNLQHTTTSSVFSSLGCSSPVSSRWISTTVCPLLFFVAIIPSNKLFYFFISAPLYYLKNSDGKCLTQYVTGGTSKTNVYNYNNMNFQACANGDSQKWYFLDKGAGSFQIVNVAYKCQLDCSSSNSVYLNVNSYDNDNQKWTSNGNNLQNKAYSNAYLTNNSGSPGLSIWSYSWTLQLVWISFNFIL